MARKGGLGRGLESLLGETAGEVGDAHDATTLPIDLVHPNENQPRKNFDEDALSELTDSIAQNGVLQPILVRPQGSEYQIVAGERRYQAAQRAGLTEVPVVVRDISDEDVLRLALIENLQRTDLNPMEEAQGYKALMDQEGLTQEELAEVVSKSRSAVANSLRLLRLPEQVQAWVRDGKLSAGHARALLALESNEDKLKLAQRIMNEGLSVRQTETLASLVSGGHDQKSTARSTTAAQPEAYQHASKRLSDLLNAKVRVRQVRGKRKIEIEFASDEDLARLLEQFDLAATHESQETSDED